jgi:hypothetical protein
LIEEEKVKKKREKIPKLETCVSSPHGSRVVVEVVGDKVTVKRD